MRRFVAVAVLALLAGCATAPGEAPVSSTPTPSASSAASSTPVVTGYQACLAATPAGLDDAATNQAARAGLTSVADSLGIDVQALAATDDKDYPALVDRQIASGCELVTLIGHAEVAVAAAEAHPEVNFLLVGAQTSSDHKNLKSLIFDSSGAAFLAGYLAAAQSSSGTVATFGADQDPDTVVAMNGFVGGVQHHNQTKGTTVQVLGWDETTQQGVFLPTVDEQAARTVAEEYTAQGADIIYPVAGQTSRAVLDLALASNGSLAVIWDGADGCAVTDGCSVILSSVVDNVAQAVSSAVTAAAAGSFDPATAIATMENGGVVLADFHDFDAKVSAETRSEIDQIRSGLTNGTLEAPAAG